MDYSCAHQKICLKKWIVFAVSALICFVCSFLYILEPKRPYPTGVLETTFTISPEQAFLVVTADGGYDLYVDDKYLATINDYTKAFSDFKIYKNISEANDIE